MSEIKKALNWHKQATPNPSSKTRCIALGVHFEEVAEMLEALGLAGDAVRMHNLADDFKSCEDFCMYIAEKAHRIKLLDSIIDQNVTSCGISNAYGFDHIDALAEVNNSNYSKFENGKPVFNEQGKISKGVNYKAPELARFVK